MQYSRVNVTLNVEFFIEHTGKEQRLSLEEQVKRNINGWQYSGADVTINEPESLPKDEFPEYFKTNRLEI